MIEIAAHDRGALLPVRAQAGARKNAIVGEHNGRLRIAVTAAPEKGKANKAIVALLSKVLAVPKSTIELVSGETSPQKRFVVMGVAPQELAARLEPYLGEAT